LTLPGPAVDFSDQMSDADAVMWNLEKDPLLRSTITALAVLDRAPDWGRVVHQIDRASRDIVRMRQRVLTPPLRLSPPRWVVDHTFDLSYHLRRFEAPSPKDLRAVLEIARASAMAGFDRARPLWEFTLVEGLADGRAVLVEKVHHSVTDGVGGIRLAMSLYDSERDLAPRPLPDSPPVERWNALRLMGESAAQARRRALAAARRSPLMLVERVTATATHPRETFRRARATARSVAKTLAPVRETLSPLMRERGLGWQFDVFDIRLDDCRRAAKALGSSLNDVFVAGVGGGLARYHDLHGAPVTELRMTLPINLRSESDPRGGNHFAPARFVVPVGIKDPAERVRLVSELVRSWRAEPALALTDTLAGLLNRLPTIVVTGLFGAMLKHVDFVSTNVPGFATPVYLGGAEVVGHYVLPPPSGAAVNVGLMTHLDRCCIGVTTDTAAVPDHEVLAACLADGLQEVVDLGR
jgi:WS/DGAT/MGAT family acyltransferase